MESNWNKPKSQMVFHFKESGGLWGPRHQQITPPMPANPVSGAGRSTAIEGYKGQDGDCFVFDRGPASGVSAPYPNQKNKKGK